MFSDNPELHMSPTKSCIQLSGVGNVTEDTSGTLFIPLVVEYRDVAADSVIMASIRRGPHAMSPNYCVGQSLDTPPQGKLAGSSGVCVFPFTYAGVVHRTCVSPGAYGGVGWCSFIPYIDDDSDEWGYCTAGCPSPLMLSSTASYGDAVAVNVSSVPSNGTVSGNAFAEIRLFEGFNTSLDYFVLAYMAPESSPWLWSPGSATCFDIHDVAPNTLVVPTRSANTSLDVRLSPDELPNATSKSCSIEIVKVGKLTTDKSNMEVLPLTVAYNSVPSDSVLVASLRTGTDPTDMSKGRVTHAASFSSGSSIPSWVASVLEGSAMIGYPTSSPSIPADAVTSLDHAMWSATESLGARQ